jgi:nitrite reductase (NO-forming)
MPFPGMRTENERRDVLAYLAAAAAPGAGPVPAPSPQPRGSVSYIPDIRYTLRSGIAEGRMVFIGVGGTIDGQVNPVLSAAEGQVVQITLINGEGAEHDIGFPQQNARSPRITAPGASTTLAFRAERAGDFSDVRTAEFGARDRRTIGHDFRRSPSRSRARASSRSAASAPLPFW